MRGRSRAVSADIYVYTINMLGSPNASARYRPPQTTGPLDGLSWHDGNECVALCQKVSRWPAYSAGEMAAAETAYRPH